MPGAAIQIRGLSKSYALGARSVASYRTLREDLRDGLRRLFRPRARREEFWALKDVTLDVPRGEVMGIVGRNGAGKSTLLKILSRITEPTSGFADVEGRVGSLLEVGTGFHPELTGRENVFLNGALLGMKRAEILRKFQEIVAFAEIDRFLDTPVKRYSSGMYVRLAFAVAAHLEPEVLIVDEVLAVGDAEFQRKCLGKMENVASGGRTVLFVSHNLNAVRRLCSTCALLREGRLASVGPTAGVLNAYMADAFHGAGEFRQAADDSRPAQVRRAALVGADGKPRVEVDWSEILRFEIEYEIRRPVERCVVWAAIRSLDETLVFGTADYDSDPALIAARVPGYYRSAFEVPARLLNSGSYYLVVGITGQAPLVPYDRIDAIHFSLVDTTAWELAEGANRPGVLKPLIRWEPASRQADA